MNVEKILLFVYKIFPKIKKYRLQKFQKYLEPFGIEEFISQYKFQKNSEKIQNLTQIKGKKYKQLYDNFKKILEENFDSDDLHNFYYNSEWVIVNKFTFNPFTTSIGFYDLETNKIKFKLTSFNHEFFHLASTNNEFDSVISGFHISDKEKSLGYSLTEGYTDLLTERYFNENIEDYYFLEAKYARGLERIIGKKTMEKLYFRADFVGFIKELKKYYDISEIEKFLINMDVILLYRKKYLCTEEIIKINLLIEDCICFLLKGFCKVMNDSKCCSENKKLQIFNFYNDIRWFYKFYDHEHVMDMKKIGNVIKENFNEEILVELFGENLNKKQTTNFKKI